MSKKVSEFFDRQAGKYFEAPSDPMAPFQVQIANTLQETLRGSVLCVGGLWDYVDLARTRCRLVVADVSKGMMSQHVGPLRVVSDGRTLAFRDQSAEHVVLSLVLHHVAGSSARDARANVRTVLEEAGRVLKPGGRIWISELCPPRAVYVAELVASPLTQLLLKTADIPFVVMHSPGFYRSVLEDLGFADVVVDRIRSDEAGPMDMLEPVAGLSWLRIPRFMFPVNQHLITAQR